MKYPPHDDQWGASLVLLIVGTVVAVLLVIGLSHVAINELGPEPVSTLTPLEAP